MELKLRCLSATNEGAGAGTRRLVMPPDDGTGNDRRLIACGLLVQSSSTGRQIMDNLRQMQREGIKIDDVHVRLRSDAQYTPVIEPNRARRLCGKHVDCVGKTNLILNTVPNPMGQQEG